MVLKSSFHPAPYPLFTFALFSQVSFDATAAAHDTATGAHALSNQTNLSGPENIIYCWKRNLAQA